jgi:eukaryotic-like serine/threonine-protein kinase
VHSERPIPLGPFDLIEPIGRGSMAEVWGGVHRTSGVDVAVKILTDETTRRRSWIVNFRNEIRAVAGLSHASIVHVDDYGEIDEEDEEVLSERFGVGCPYLVMERVLGGSLRTRLGSMAWPEIRFVLLQLLDALAHAHSRGLIHRDITPGNVLGQGAVVKLADFGLCHWLAGSRGQRERAITAGTPAYMAPEQWEGRWRDFGPWTDLYGVGCLGWALATGNPPFGAGGELADMRASHLSIRIPRLDPVAETPPGFEEWLSLCLRKDPARRLQRASDAIWRLLELPVTFASEPRIPDEDGRPTMEMQVLESLRSVILPDEDEQTGELLVADHPAEGPTPTLGTIRVPRSWRDPGPPPARRLLPGAGLRLLAFRTIPLVGRQPEQDRLWEALIGVAEDRHPRAVVLHGAAGCGKSRLARWLSERAHEVGAAIVLRVDHDPVTGGVDPLAAMIRSRLRLDRASEEEVQLRLRKHLDDHDEADPYELAALMQLLRPSTDPRSTRAFGLGAISPSERRAIVGRLVRRLCRQRPVILWLDDVQWGAESIRFAQDLLSVSDRPLPVLVVATARDDALADQPVERELLAELETHERCAALPVGPLRQGDWEVLIQRIVLLEPELTRQVANRAAGNPLFAVQLIADWVQRGLLQLGEGGFTLIGGAVLALPDDIHEVWSRRVEDLLARLPKTDAEALELAAVLGERVETDEWVEACRLLGAEPSTRLMERLLANRLARYAGDPEDGVWAFAHGMLRESLERRVADSGRAARLHRVCVRMLEVRPRSGARERIGGHLLAAHDPAAAAGPLLDGAAERADQGDFARAEVLISQREEALEDAGVPSDDPRWGEGLILVAGLEVERHRLDRAAELTERLLDQALEGGWARIEGWGRQILGRVACLRGDLASAREQLEGAAALAHLLGDDQLAMACGAAMGMVMLLEGQFGTARAITQEARDEFLKVGLDHGAAAMSLQLSLVALQQGEVDEATRHVTTARGEFERLGARNSLAQCQTQLGAIARARGDDAAARRHLRTALERYRALGAEGWLAPLVKLAVLCVDAGEYGEARALLLEGMAGLEQIGGWTSMGVLQVLLLPSVAAQGDWESWDRLAPEADVMLSGAGLVHEDIPRLARLGGDLALAAGHTERARRAWLLALSQWRRLGELSPARELASKLARLAVEQDAPPP